MLTYLFRRLGLMVFTILAVSLIVFLLMHLGGGDPTALLLPLDATEADRAELRARFGLDQPLPVQYVRFVSRAVQGDFGQSLQHRRPALGLVLDRYPNTFQLALTAIGLAVSVGLLIGIPAALSRDGPLDRLSILLSMLGQSVPGFWLGIMMILIFSVMLNWLPTSGKSDWKSFILPSIALATGFIAQIILLVRSSMKEVLEEQYITTARGKGLPERTVIMVHAFRNMLIPLLTYVGLVFGVLLGGAVITETVFAWPGVGLLAVNAIYARDYPLVQASVFTLALGIVVVNMLVDLTYVFLDPRIRRN